MIRNAGTLYDIKEKYLSLIEEIEENEGVMTEEQEAALQITLDDFADKFRAYGVRIKMIKSEEDYLKEQATKFNNAAKTISNVSKKLKETILLALELFGEDSVSGGKRFKDEYVNMYTTTRISADATKTDAENFEEYSIVNVDFHLSPAEMQEVYKFVASKFGMDRVFQKGVALKKSSVSEHFKKGILIYNNYYFDANGNEVTDVKEEDADKFEVRRILTNVTTGKRYDDIGIFENVGLTVR